MINTVRRYFKTGTNIAEAKSTSRIVETSRLFLHRVVTGYGYDHYLAYSLFDKPVSLQKWRQYVDKRDFCELLFRYNKKQHFSVLENKVAFGAACLRHNLPHPNIVLTCNYAGPQASFENFTTGTIASGLADLVPGNYIVKTCDGSYGINLWSIKKANNSIQVHNLDQQLSAQQFATLLEKSGESYLVQKKIEVAQTLRSIMPGLGCGTMRVMTFLRPDGSVAQPYCFIKLTTAVAISDNFSGNAWGNMLAIINMKNFTIERVVSKAANGLYCGVTHHPDTGVDLRNYPVPEVQQALDLGRRCALVFPDIPAVGWDIVVTDQGAVVLEGNPMFDPIGPQLCANRGIKDIIPRLLEDASSHTV